jgi:sugar O-acyltransferase (sialic acid O-acetyltransferase NeuD family)
VNKKSGRKIIIFGAGDIARLAKYYFDTDSDYQVEAFCVDGAFKNAERFLDLPLLDFETIEKKFSPQTHSMFVALGYNKMNHVRADKYLAAKLKKYELISYISSRCSYLSQYPAGDNCFILEDNTIQPYVKIGNNVTLWSGNHIGHDSIIHDHCFISSHVVVSGHCEVSSYCFLGVNSTLRNSIKIAEECIIGAGAIIMKDTQRGEIHLPARSIVSEKKSSEVEL